MKYRIKGLTLRHPWLWMIKHAGKNVKNRVWQPYTAPTHIALHGGAFNNSRQYNLEIYQALTWVAENVPGQEKLLDNFPNANDSEILCLTGIHGIAPWRGIVQPLRNISPWHVKGQFGWRLEDIIWLPEPIQCTGARSLWHLPEHIHLELEHVIRNHKPTPQETATVIAKSDLFGVLP